MREQNKQLKEFFKDFEAVYKFWVIAMPKTQKALWCRVPYEIPYINLRNTTWGKQYKERIGKEYGEN